MLILQFQHCELLGWRFYLDFLDSGMVPRSNILKAGLERLLWPLH
jgi:hypothetical protein